jgi:hypothetical protein
VCWSVRRIPSSAAPLDRGHGGDDDKPYVWPSTEVPLVVAPCTRSWDRQVNDYVKWTTMSTTCVFFKFPSAMFVRERNPHFRSSRVSSPLLPSRRVFLSSLCSCVGNFFVFYAMNPSDGWHQRLEEQTSLVVRPDQGPTPPVPIWAAWPPALTSCALHASHYKILTPENPMSIWVQEGPWNIKIRKIGFSYPAEL